MQITLPKFLHNLLLLLFYTSAFVFVEPAPFDILFVATLIIFIVSGYIKFQPEAKFFVLLLALYTIFCIFSILMAIDLTEAVTYCLITIYLIMLSLFVGFLAGTCGINTVHLIFKAMVISMVVSLVLAATSLVGIVPLSSVASQGETRLRGFFKDPNVFGPTLACLTIYLLSLIGQEGLKYKRLYLAALAIFIFTIPLTYSRATIGIFIIGSLLFFGLKYRFRVNKVAFRNSIPVVILAGIIVLFMSINSQSSVFLKERMQLHDYDTDRFFVHRLILAKSLEYPLGMGPGQTNVWLARYYSFISGSNAAHNTTLRVLLENGFPAAIIFTAFTIYVLWQGFVLSWRNWPHRDLSAACTASLACFIINSIVIDTLHWRILWIILGLILGLKIIYRKTQTA